MAYERAGITDPLHEIDFVELHDAYTSCEIQTYEDLGLCRYGEGGPFAASGRAFMPGSGLRAGIHSSPSPNPQRSRRCPVNPSGGLIACGHPVGATGLMQGVFALWQLQGTIGKHFGDATLQFENARRGAIHSHAGTGTYVTVSILERGRGDSHAEPSFPTSIPNPLTATIVQRSLPDRADPDALAVLKRMAPIRSSSRIPITICTPTGRTALRSPGWQRRLLAATDPGNGYTYATPRGDDMYTGAETDWIDITHRPAKVHAFTVCYFGSEEFLPECPFVLALIEFEGVNTLFLTRLMGLDPQHATLDWIGKRVGRASCATASSSRPMSTSTRWRREQNR